MPWLGSMSSVPADDHVGLEAVLVAVTFEHMALLETMGDEQLQEYIATIDEDIKALEDDDEHTESLREEIKGLLLIFSEIANSKLYARASQSTAQAPEESAAAQANAPTINRPKRRGRSTLEEARAVIRAFIERYNNGWLLQRHGYMTPARAREKLSRKAA